MYLFPVIYLRRMNGKYLEKFLHLLMQKCLHKTFALVVAVSTYIKKYLDISLTGIPGYSSSRKNYVVTVYSREKKARFIYSSLIDKNKLMPEFHPSVVDFNIGVFSGKWK